MKRIICLILMMVLGLSLCACNNAGGNGGKNGAELKVGFARESMMPETEVTIAGGEDPNRISQGYLEDLTATCIALTDANDNTVLIYTVDMQCLTSTFLGGSKQIVSQATGIPVSNIMISCTHNHSSPSHVMDHTGISAFQKGPFQNALVNAGKKALEDRSAAAISIGEVQSEGLVFVRHYEMQDGTFAGPSYGDLVDSEIVGQAYESDHTIQLIQFARAAEDKKDIVLFNLGAHATYFSSTATKNLSSDFPGPARDYVEMQADCHAAYFISAAGDQTPNSRDPKLRHNMSYKEFGQKLGQYVVDGLRDMKSVNGGEVKITEVLYNAPSNKPDPDKDFGRAVELWNLFQQQGYDIANKMAREEGFKSIYECRSIVQSGSFPATRAVNINVVSAGDISFAIFSGEMFSTTGRYLRENSPYEMTFVATLANGYNGYMPDERGYDFGCYEAYSSYVARGTAEKLGEEYIKMLKEHKGQ